MDFPHCSCSLFSTVKLLIILVSFSDDWIYYINYFETQKKKNANEKIKPFFVYENDNLAYLHLFEVQILLEKFKILLCSARKIVCRILSVPTLYSQKQQDLAFPKEESRKLGNVVNSIQKEESSDVLSHLPKNIFAYLLDPKDQEVRKMCIEN